MASITICDRISKDTKKLTLSDVNVKGNVVELKSLISKEIKAPPQDIELVYCGQCLSDQNSVDGYGIQEGSMVYALKKQHHPENVKPGPVKDADMRQMKSTLRSALINPAYRSTVERLLADPQELERILKGTPGLENDPVSLAMLHDPELLAILINPMNINSVLSAHPALAQAAIIISSAVNKEVAKSGSATGISSTGTYSLDQMSDDEDNMAPSQASGSSGSGQAITASQLAAALNAATGNLSSGTGSSRQTDTPSRITSDFFQQALLQAQGAHAAPPDESTMQSQLEQLRDMGIEDEDVARRALQASGGDIHMALNLIFGDGNL